MPPEVPKLLWDMDDAATKIQRYANGRTFDDFIADDYFRAAVERQFATIGEAMTRLHRVAPDVAERISDHRKIQSFRNVIIHGYDVIDDAVTWGVIEQKLPILLADIARVKVELSLPSAP